MYGPPLFAVDLNFATTRLEQDRDSKRLERMWTNIIVLVADVLLMWFGKAKMSYEHSILVLLNLATFGFLMDRVNRLHIKYIGDQINLLICVGQRGSEAQTSMPT